MKLNHDLGIFFFLIVLVFICDWAVNWQTAWSIYPLNAVCLGASTNRCMVSLSLLVLADRDSLLPQREPLSTPPGLSGWVYWNSLGDPLRTKGPKTSLLLVYWTTGSLDHDNVHTGAINPRRQDDWWKALIECRMDRHCQAVSVWELLELHLDSRLS